MRFITKTILITFVLLNLIQINTWSQQVYEITAKDAVDIAFKNVNDLKNAKLDYKIAEARNKEITGLALPQVSGSLQGNHYLSLPIIQFPDATESFIYQVLKDNGVKDGSGNPINKTVDPTVRNVSFFTPWNVNAGLAVNQLLFEPQVFCGFAGEKRITRQQRSAIKSDRR